MLPPTMIGSRSGTVDGRRSRGCLEDDVVVELVVVVATVVGVVGIAPPVTIVVVVVAPVVVVAIVVVVVAAALVVAAIVVGATVGGTVVDGVQSCASARCASPTTSDAAASPNAITAAVPRPIPWRRTLNTTATPTPATSIPSSATSRGLPPVTGRTQSVMSPVFTVRPSTVPGPRETLPDACCDAGDCASRRVALSSAKQDQRADCRGDE